MNEDILILTENETKIDLIENWWDVQKQCRRDYYYLKSLKIKLDNNMYIIKGSRTDKEIIEKKKSIRALSKQSANLLRDFEIHDNDLVENDSKSEIAADGLTFKPFKDNAEIVNKLKYAYLLIEKINKLQCEIFQIVIEELEYECDELAKGESNMELIILQYRRNLLLNKMLNHSTDEDRIDTIKVNVCDKKVRQEFYKSHKIKIPFAIKVTNYYENLNSLREIYRALNILQHELLMMKDENKKNRIQEQRNYYQYIFNIIVTIITILTFARPLLSLLANILKPADIFWGPIWALI